MNLFDLMKFIRKIQQQKLLQNNIERLTNIGV